MHYKKKTTLAIIPARYGSKSIKHKNFKLFCDKPLIVWTMDFVKDLTFVDYSVISSDSKEIENIASIHAFNFIKRPKRFAKDKSTTEEAIFHVIEELFKKKLSFDNILIFEPTSPLRSKLTVNKLFKLYCMNNIDSLFTVSRTNKLFGTLHNNRFLPFEKKVKRRRQDRNELFYEVGVVYIIKSEYFKKKKKLVTNNSFAYEVDEYESFDINSEKDFLVTEFLYKTSFKND